MNSKYAVIAAIIAVLLVGSAAFSHSAEAKSKTGKIKVGFGDARGYEGTGKIKIWNLDNDDKVLVKGKINFAKLDVEGCFCKTFSFKWKGNHVGDRIALSVGVGNDGGWTDDSGQGKLKQGTTHASITLDEIGE